MPNRMRLKLSGRWRFRFQTMRILIGSGLSVMLHRIQRGPLLPSWTLLFEASSHFQKAIYTAVYRYPDIKDGRELLDALQMKVPSLDKVRVEPVSSPVRGDWFRPEALNSTKVILYCHGAYAFYANTEKCLIADLAMITGLPVFAFDYRLTPEHPFPAQLNDAVASYNWLLDLGYQGSDIIVFGTSAGGNLCLSLLLELRDTRRLLPKMAICFSPWTDIGNSGESIDKNERFDILDRSMLAQGARWFVGDDSPQNPRVSPIHADLNGLPPVYIQAGGREIFIDMIRAFYDKAKSGSHPLECWLKKE
jgi:monoterpene epsilon-lactone hydrolase